MSSTIRLPKRFYMRSFLCFKTSPDCGDPACLCSWCEQLITADDAPAIRMTNGANEEARFHRHCVTPAMYGSGLLPATHEIDDEDQL